MKQLCTFRFSYAARTIFAALTCIASSWVSGAGTDTPYDSAGNSRSSEPYQGVQIDTIDRINLLNGGVSLVIPIGRTYPVGADLSYGLTLAYNSKIFDLKLITTGQSQVPPYNFFHNVKSSPNRHSNAGIGWTLSLGGDVDSWCYDRTEAPSPQYCLRYTSTDGAEHVLYPVLNAYDGSARAQHATGYFYTRDSTYVRVHFTDLHGVDTDDTTQHADVAYPDGRVYVFNATSWGTSSRTTKLRFVQMHDSFKNAAGAYVNTVTVDYGVTGQWSVRDSTGRSHVVQFQADPSGANTDGVVSSIDLQEFRGSHAGYSFVYGGAQNISPGPQDTSGTGMLPVVFLQGIGLPDTSTFAMTNYAHGDPNAQSSEGFLRSFALPTGGSVQYTYQNYSIPSTGCTPSSSSRLSAGIATRTVLDGSGASGMWTYTPLVTDYRTLPNGTPPGIFFCDRGDVHTNYDASEEFTNTVTTPTHDKVIHFFTVWSKPVDPTLSSQPQISPNGFNWNEYGLAVSHSRTLNFGGRTLGIATQTIDCDETTGICPSKPCGGTTGRACISPCTVANDGTGSCPVPDRTEYAAYEEDSSIVVGANATDGTDLQPRVSTQATVYETDIAGNAGNPQPRVKGTVYSSFDGFGHYRSASRSGLFFPDSARRTTFNGFNPSQAYTTYPVYDPASNPVVTPRTSAWLLNLYDKITANDNTSTFESRFCFDTNTGFLLGKRVLLTAGTEAVKDLLSIYSGVNPATNVYTGDVWDELNYGGAYDTYTTSGACAKPTVAAEHEIRFTHLFGVRATTQIAGVAYLSQNDTIDSSGLVSASRDSAGVGTAFEYDTLGRKTWVEPGADASAPSHPATHDAWTEIQYNRATLPGAPCQVSNTPSQWSGCATVQVRHRTSGSKTGTVLREEWSVFDGLGRVIRERRRMPGGSVWSERSKTYNILGFNTFVSEADSQPTFGTTFKDFDPYGRPGTVVRADAHKTTFSYAGERAVNRVEQIGTGVSSSGGACAADSSNCKYLTTEAHDVLGRIYQVILPATMPNDSTGTTVTTVTYQYDAADHITSINTRSPRDGSQTRAFSYDGRGFRRTETLPEQQIAYNFYDAHGNFHQRLDGKNDVQLSFDAADRLLTMSDNTTGQPLKRFTYDTAFGRNAGLSNGKVVQAHRLNYRAGHTLDVIQDFTYLARQGRTSARAMNMVFDNSTTTDSERFDQSFSYNDLGYADAVPYPACAASFSACAASAAPTRTVPNIYAYGLLVGVQGYANLGYEPSPFLRQIAFNNGQVWQQDRDASKIPRTAFICIRSVTDSQACPAGSGLGPYTYDGVGNVLAVGGERYVYDARSRVASGALSSGQSQSYTYDAFDNVQCVTSNVAGFSRWTPTSAANNRIAAGSSTLACGAPQIGSVAYDTAGNLTAMQGSSYEFDALNKLARVVSGTYDWYYMYDAYDERVLQTSITNPQNTRLDRWTLRGLDGLPLRTYDASGFVFHWSKDYIYEGDRLIAAEAPAPEGTSRYFTDHLGTPRIINNGAGAFGHHYFPFGEEPLGSGDQEIYKFAGHERDFNGSTTSSDDLDYVHARMQSPAIGRFLSPDPGTHLDQAGSLYAYVRNNPMRLVDPTGLVDEPPSGVPSTETYKLDYGDAVAFDTYTTTQSEQGETITISGGPLLDKGIVTGTAADPIAILITGGTSSFMAFGRAGAEIAVSTLAEETTFSAIGSTGKIGEDALKALGGESQVFFPTSQGGRFVDQLVNGVANESKVGYQSLTKGMARQIAKDTELIQTGRVGGATWHFFRSPVTGLVGPSKPLMDALGKAGINVIVH